MKVVINLPEEYLDSSLETIKKEKPELETIIPKIKSTKEVNFKDLEAVMRILGYKEEESKFILSRLANISCASIISKENKNPS